MIAAADRSEISCSPDRPPYNTATRCRLVILRLLPSGTPVYKATDCIRNANTQMPRDLIVLNHGMAVASPNGRRCDDERHNASVVRISDGIRWTDGAGDDRHASSRRHPVGGGGARRRHWRALGH